MFNNSQNNSKQIDIQGRIITDETFITFGVTL